MAISIELKPLATNIIVTDATLTITLADGRVLSVPVSWFPRLAQATSAQRADWRLMGNGSGIHWEAIDEDLSVPQLLGLPCD